MSKAIFTAGLNWKMVENKWPNFLESFRRFSPRKVSAMTEKDVKTLMKETGIVRNEKKIRATIENAKAILELEKKYGSVREYIGSYGREETRLQEDLRKRFKHLGPSSARMFLWSVGYPLTPTTEEKAWMKGHHER